MVDWNIVCFDIAVSISGLFMLEYGADKFVDHTAILARRLGISPALVALLTAGAEWEELAVVIASLSQRRPSLALGNVLGSTISNILGAFSLGLLFQTGHVTYDNSSKIYTGILFVVTSAFAALAGFGLLNRFVGGSLLVTFVIYVASVCWWIYKGVLAAPENSDDGSSDDNDPDTEEEVGYTSAVSEESPLLQQEEGPMPRNVPPHARQSLVFHIAQVVLGFLAVSISGYILSHAVASLSDALHLSETVLGLTLLSLATTLPEKFVAMFSGARGHVSILVATTAGSNIFLLTLCLGIVLLSSDGAFDQDPVNVFEIMVMWASSALLTLIVLVGSQRWMGIVMIILYLAFIILEITLRLR